MVFRGPVYAVAYWCYEQAWKTEEERVVSITLFRTIVVNWIAIAMSWWLARSDKSQGGPSGKRDLNILAAIPLALSSAEFLQNIVLPIGAGKALHFLVTFTFLTRLVEICVLGLYDYETSIRERLLHCVSPIVEVCLKEPLDQIERFARLRSVVFESVVMILIDIVALYLVVERGSFQLSYWIVSFLAGTNILCWVTLEGLIVEFMYLVFDSSSTPKVMIYPFLSTSVREFWSKRWNRAVHYLLKRYVYVPIRKIGLGSAFATLATFIASALYHIVPLMVGGMTFKDTSSHLVFFSIQAVGMFLESVLKVHKLPSALRWVWTVGWCVTPIPLFTTPYFTSLGMEVVPPM